ncbi:MAG: TIM barrel protein [Oscillospiraceae bacterium]|nr:TIM barrel protein [Oscillospiraceae bacterium]
MFFGACIDTLYTELPWSKRFAAAKTDGFDCVEFWDWRKIDLRATKGYADEAGIWISGFNGDADFSLIDPAHRQDYLEYLRRSLEAASILGAPGVTVHSNALGEGGIVVNHYDELPDTVKLCAMYDTLYRATELAGTYGTLLHLEALNVYTDHAGNYLKYTKTGAEIIRMINSPHLKLLYDAYHMQINEGRLCDTLSEHIGVIGHVHIADAPGRHEPDTGEINYINVLRHLNRLGYRGAVGCELSPAESTEEAVKAIMTVKQASI